MLSSDGLSASQAMDYASSHPSSGENQSLFRSDLRGRIGIPLASSDPGVPLFNLSILDQRIDSLRRFLSRVIETHASIGDEQIDLVSQEIGSSIHQIILNGAALLATSQNQSFGPGVGGWTGSITEKMPDMVDPRAPPMSSFAEEVNDPTKGKASEPSDLRDLTIKSPYLVDREFLRNPEDLRIPSAVQEIADLKFSFCSDSRNLKIPAAGDGNPADPKFPEKSTASRKLSSDSRNINLKILADQGIQAAEDRNLIGRKFQDKSTISRNLSGNTADLKPPFGSDSRNLKIPAKQVIPAAADGNLVDLKDLEESTTSRNLKNPAHGGGKDDDEGDDTDAEIIELDSVELLAEHTHFCDICGKGFKRDANLRMHKRAHGNQFKTVEALSKPDRYEEDRGKKTLFSCPFAGCNRNKSHRRFRPLKSAVCVKNHFKRSHCPKMYSCNRCNQKSFSVVSDLKSHLKHCGECRWRCSCGTSFSRKDKLFGHVALFEGHMPAVVGEDQSKAVDLEEEMQVDREEHVETADAEVSDFGFFDGLLEGFGSIEAGSLEDLLGSL